MCGHGVRHRSPGRRYDDRQRGVALVAISCITIYGAGCATDLHAASPACIRICILVATPPDSTIDYRSTSSTVKSLYSYNFENSCRARSFSRVMYQNSWFCFWEKLIRVLAQNEELVRDFLTCMNSLKRTRSVHKKYHIKLSTA